MNSAVIFLAVCFVCMVTALPYSEFIEDENGVIFQLLPSERVRRSCGSGNKGEVYGRADVTDPGRVVFGYEHTINNANHRLDAHAFATDNIRHHSPLTYGGEANYLHKPTGSTAYLAATRTEQWGTDLEASGKWNFFQDKTTNANIEGYASKHMGGLPGNQPIDYGIKLNVQKDF